MAPSRGRATHKPKSVKATKVVKPRAARARTESSRHHSYRSFSSHILALKIAPLRSSRSRADLQPLSADLSTAASSHFATQLREWQDLNLSAHFSAYADAAAPLAESLPMVLHNEAALVDALLTAIAGAGKESLEPLCSLLGHLAHDLDFRFEAYFTRAWDAVALKVKSEESVEGIEWGFEALAWIAKYMSRVLLGAGEVATEWWSGVGRWLGKEKQRPFVVRFMGEVVGFLLRRASRSKDTLDRVLGALVDDYLEQEQEMHAEGLKVALSEAVKGVSRGVNVDGVVAFESTFAMLKSTTPAKKKGLMNIVTGSLIATIHHTDATGFEPVLRSILDFSTGTGDSADRAKIGAELLFTAVCTRKGSRVQDWSRTTKTAFQLARGLPEKVNGPVPEIGVALVGSVLLYAPILTASSHKDSIEQLGERNWTESFLKLCFLVADKDQERFRSLLLPTFQRFILSQWQTLQAELTLAVIRLSDIKALSRVDVKAPSFENASSGPSTTAIVTHDQHIQLYRTLKHFQRVHGAETSECEKLAGQILAMQKDCASDASSEELKNKSMTILAFGAGALYAAETLPLSHDGLFTLIKVMPTFSNTSVYWEALVTSLGRAVSSGQALSEVQIETLMQHIHPALRSWKHELRVLALRCLNSLFDLQSRAWPEICEVMSSIEETPPTVQTSRFISSQIRRLALGYPHISSDPILGKAVPNYCFGLLHLQLSQAWDDAVQVLKDISSVPAAEAVILEAATNWLEGGPEPSLDNTLNWQPHEPEPALTGFQCSNVNEIQASVRNAVFAGEEPQQKFQQMFDDEHRAVPLATPFNRTQALRVLRALPQIAEKRSRVLVPVLLQWIEKEIASNSEASVQRWNRKDQKAMLDVFAQFQNPRVLYRTSEVYDAMLKLLANGDVEIQRSALKAILSWKQSAVIKYEQHLNNLLDDARFREEISVFLRPSEEDGVQAEDIEQLSPVLLRLLYGLLVNRSGTASGVRGKQMKRKAVFGALAQFPDSVLKHFINIALEPVESQLLHHNDCSLKERLQHIDLHPRKQIGVLNTVDDMLGTLASDMMPYRERLADVSLACLFKSRESAVVTDTFESEDSHAALSKSIRQTSSRCLVQIFTHMPGDALLPYGHIVFAEMIQPRLEQFVAEFAQSISGVLRLVAAWSLRTTDALELLLKPQGIVLGLTAALESALAPKDVKRFILDNILLQLTGHSQGITTDSAKPDADAQPQSSAYSDALGAKSAPLLRALTAVIQSNQDRDGTDSALACIAQLATCVHSVADIRNFLEVAAVCLTEPSKKIPISTKRELLRTVHGLLPQAALGDQSVEEQSTKSALYKPLCSLFGLFRDREGRQLLCDVLEDLGSGNVNLFAAGKLCSDLNSFAEGRVEEPDYDRRSVAYVKINENLYSTLDAAQWRPLLFNMLYFVRDEDLSIRTSASFSLQRFVQAVTDHSRTDSGVTNAFSALILKVVLPGIKEGLRSTSELVRTEYLTVLSLFVKELPTESELSDLSPLLAGNDDEASFFHNVLHVQQHRRLRALRRLASEAEKGSFTSTNTATILFPLLEHFIFDAGADEGAHNVTAEAIASIGALAASLDWSQFRAILRRYISLMRDMEGKEKTIFRLIGVMVDALRRASPASGGTPTDGVPNGDSVTTLRLKQTMPGTEVFASIVTGSFLPPLLNFLHEKDDSTVSLRVPVGVVVVKMLKCVPEDVLILKLPGALMDLCYILRSRDQGSRDMTRKTLTEVTGLLGPAYFNFIIKALRGALQRGYQLHVLSFTIHSILVDNLTKLQPGDMDSCLPDLVSIIMDDIFGVTGQEKDAEEYISRMKEVKSSKSFDSMEVVAKITTLPHLRQLVMPVRTLLKEKIDLKTAKKIDELLRRLALGISQNAGVVDRDILVFCFELIRLEQRTREKANAPSKNFDDYKTRRYIVQMEAANKSSKRGATSSYTFKLTRFAVDMLRSVLQKHPELSTPENLAGFVPVISEAMVSGQEEVQLSVIRLLTSINRVPLPELEANSSVYIAEAVRLIKAAPAMTSESAQAALKLMSSTLRDRSSSKIREVDLAYIFTRLKPDLEEPDRQGVIFNFLKSVLGRKIVITEVYEIMDMVGGILVTNQTRQARDLARGVYFQFMMDYPQTKERLHKQISFMVKNMEYEYPEGRQSVLELLHLLLQKAGESTLQTISGSVFVPLVMVLANDENAECREMAGVLIKQVLSTSSVESVKTYDALLRQWLQQDDQILLQRVSLQIWKMRLEGEGAGDNDVDFLLQFLSKGLNVERDINTDSAWEVLYYGLQVFAQIVQSSPRKAYTAKAKPIWDSVQNLLDYPHAWVKLAASKLVGTLFGEIGKVSKDSGLASTPLKTGGQIQLSEPELRQLCRQGLRVLRHDLSSQQLLAQTSRNIVFLGKCFGATGMGWDHLEQHSNGVNGDHEHNDLEDGLDDSEADVDEQGEGGNETHRTALEHLLLSLCSVVRRNHSATSPASLPPKLAALQILSALTNTVDSKLYAALLPTILHPLLLLTDPSIPRPVSANPSFTEQYAALTQAAQEALSQLQGRAGSTAYVAAVGKATARVRERREERRVKRRIEAVALPERAERRKVRRVEGKARRVKERAAEYQGRRRGW